MRAADPGERVRHAHAGARLPRELLHVRRMSQSARARRQVRHRRRQSHLRAGLPEGRPRTHAGAAPVQSSGVLIGNRTSTGGKGTIGHPGREDAFASVAVSAITSLSRKRRGCRDGRGLGRGRRLSWR
ncbi:hypothetical protein NP493_855g00031 [Ridgeia piscesae]|uniref:Uncharacterized protein n=1 Tax=Ridgeia piscesae TaxID=27915 RepID=A0AAD9KNG4_RIDPI|nr:hypothetical protein NP493_855g00031 [Ridgeia piscesae]